MAAAKVYSMSARGGLGKVPIGLSIRLGGIML
jgi:hypothetical protein